MNLMHLKNNTQCNKEENKNILKIKLTLYIKC